MSNTSTSSMMPTSTSSLPPRTIMATLWHHNALFISTLYLFVLIVISVFAPWFAPHNPLDIQPSQTNIPPFWVHDSFRKPTWEFPLGTDVIGRDIVSRLIYGSRTSLFVGILTALLTIAIGTPIGVVAGFYGKWIDALLVHVTEVIYSFPAFLFFIVVMASLRGTSIGDMWNGFPILFGALALLGWADIARQVRSKTLSLKQRAYVEAATALGASVPYILRRHIIPNGLSPIIVLGTYTIPFAIFTEAALSYLGLGLPLSTDLHAPFCVSWGSMIIEAQSVFATQPWHMVAPVLVIASVTLACTVIGDSLRDILDPQDHHALRRA